MNFRKDLMMRAELSVSLSLDQKDQLLARTPQQYLKDQKAILKWLLASRQSFRKYFQRFYQNHSLMGEWLSEEADWLQEYIFKELLAYPIEEYQSKVNLSLAKPDVLLRSSTREIDRSNDVFQKRYGLEGYFASSVQPTFPHQSTILQQLKFVSSYDFYRETFRACEGKKYISYDYEKHMQAQNKEPPELVAPNRLKHIAEKATRKNIGVSLTSEEWGTTEPVAPKQRLRKLLISREFCKRLTGSRQHQGGSQPSRVMVVNHSGRPFYFKLR